MWLGLNLMKRFRLEVKNARQSGMHIGLADVK